MFSVIGNLCVKFASSLSAVKLDVFWGRENNLAAYRVGEIRVHLTAVLK